MVLCSKSAKSAFALFATFEPFCVACLGLWVSAPNNCEDPKSAPKSVSGVNLLLPLECPFKRLDVLGLLLLLFTVFPLRPFMPFRTGCPLICLLNPLTLILWFLLFPFTLNWVLSNRPLVVVGSSGVNWVWKWWVVVVACPLERCIEWLSVWLRDPRWRDAGGVSWIAAERSAGALVPLLLLLWPLVIILE